jgi:hypothetical protein
MEIDRIDHQLLDGTGEDQPILKERIIERNLYNYLIFSRRLKLRLTPFRYKKPIPDLKLLIQTQTGKINNKFEFKVKTDKLGSAEVDYEPMTGTQDRIMITPIYEDVELRSFSIMLYCTVIKQAVDQAFDIEKGKDFLEYLMDRMKDLNDLAKELEKKESELSEQIDHEALLKEYNWAVTVMKQLMNDLSVSIDIIDEQKNRIDKLVKKNNDLQHRLSDETFIRVQEKSNMDAVIVKKNQIIDKLKEEIMIKKEELIKLTEAQENIIKGQEIMTDHINKVKTLYDEAVEYLKPPPSMKVKIKKLKKSNNEN